MDRVGGIRTPAIRADVGRKLGPAVVLWLLAGALILAGCGQSLHDVVARNDLKFAEQMLRGHPGLLETHDRLGKTPLHHAVTFQRPAAVTFLIERGAQVNAADITGMTPLHTAAMFGRIEEAERLLAAGADIHARDKFGDTPLHTAAVFGAAGLIELFGEYGADAGVRNVAGKTPFELALEHRRRRTALRLKRIEQPVRSPE